jgi:hypothetical protein
MNIRAAAITGAMLAIVPVRLAGQAQAIVALDVDATTSGGPVTLTRTSNGIVNIGVVYTGTSASTANLETSPFTSDNGSISVDFIDCENVQAVRPSRTRLVSVRTLCCGCVCSSRRCSLVRSTSAG